MRWRKRGGLLLSAMMALGTAAPAAAQVAGTPVPAPSPSTTALPVPPPPVIVIPTTTPTPAAPRPQATVTPRPTPTASRATAAPTPRPSGTVSPAPEPPAKATPEAEATPVEQPAPPPTSTVSPTPTPAPAAAIAPGKEPLADDWPIAAGIAAVAALALCWVLLRRRREAHRQALNEGDVEETAFASDFPAVDAAPGAAARARLTLAFRPIRAGLNLLSATSENEITVTNTGDAPARDIRVLARLISAHTGQDAELAGIYAAPIGRPATPAFTLQPGEQRVLTTVAALPRDAIRALDAGGRPMFVPIVAVNLTYISADIEGQLAQAFAVGIERVDSPKLAPFWLDAPPRTYDQVAARPHAAALER